MKKIAAALVVTTLAAFFATCSPPPRADFAGQVKVDETRSIYLECRGSGSPTVILVSGTGGAFDEWTHVSVSSGIIKQRDTAVLPAVARFTRVCAYDRPGTRRFDGTPSPSTAVLQPTTAQNGVADLHAVLTAANEPGPYVLVGASWGGMITRLYASTYTDQVAGLVFVDSASEFLKQTLTPEQWSDWMNVIRNSKSGDNEVPDYEPSLAQIGDAPLTQTVPSVVLTSDTPWDLQVGTTGSTFPTWLTAQDLFAAQLGARHITQTNSGHGIAVEQPQMVVDAIRDIVDQIRASTPRQVLHEHGTRSHADPWQNQIEISLRSLRLRESISPSPDSHRRIQNRLTCATIIL